MKNGILSYQILKNFVDEGRINASTKIEESQFQPNTMDLRLGKKGYRVRTSFLAMNSSVEDKIEDILMYEFDLTEGAILEKNCLYIIPLQEELNLPNDIYAKTNPKSSTGRLDIFTRIITDNSFRFNIVEKGYSGKLYVEVCPISFTIRVKTGDSLNQFRLIHGENVQLSGKELEERYVDFPLLFDEHGKPIEKEKVTFNDGLYMSIDLNGLDENTIVGYKSKKNSAVIDVSKKHHYPTELFWEKIYFNPKKSLVIEPEEFYIFGSKERIVIPPWLCGEMIPYDPENGEMRVHYAGFFDSGFGFVKNLFGYSGAKAVLEIRPHDVPFQLEDGQILFRMVFDTNTETPSHIYGETSNSNYQGQGLTLSKHFK